MLKNNYKPESGSIEVICGPMFSGKTTELIKKLKKFKLKKKQNINI